MNFMKQTGVLRFCLTASVAEAGAISSLKSFIQNVRTVRAEFSQTVLDKNTEWSREEAE